MDPITFKCPSCKKPLTVPKEAANAQGPCPTCGSLIQGPGVSGSPVLLDRNPVPVAPAPANGARTPTPKAENSPRPTPPKKEPAKDKTPDPPKNSGKEAQASPTKPKKKETKSSPAAVSGTPAPKTAPEQKAQPAKKETPAPVRARRRGLGLINHVALHILGILAAFTVGYQIGERATSRQPAEDIPLVNTGPGNGPQKAREQDPNPGTGSESPPATGSGEVEDLVVEAPVEPEVTPALASLQAFLEAPKWSARQTYVLSPQAVLAEMEKTAKEEGDGPIAVQSIAKLPTRDQDTERIFELVTDKHPNGFPVSLTKVDDQWLVDWRAFVECYHEHLARHAKATTGAQGAFRVLLRPDDSGVDDYLISPPTLSDTFKARIEEGTPAHKRISSILKYYTTTFPEEYARSIEEGGIPLILDLTTADSKSGCSFLVTGFVSTTWSPAPPRTTGESAENREP